MSPYGEGNVRIPVYCINVQGMECRLLSRKGIKGQLTFIACGEYWLGNEALHKLMAIKTFKLQILVIDWNRFLYFASYDTFSLADEANGYRLNHGSYSGNAGDSMAIHNNSKFSTKTGTMMTIQPDSTMLCIIRVRGGTAMVCSQTLLDLIIHLLKILITTILSGLARLVIIIFKQQ